MAVWSLLGIKYGGKYTVMSATGGVMLQGSGSGSEQPLMGKLPVTQERSTASPMTAHLGLPALPAAADSNRDGCSVLAQRHTDLFRKALEDIHQVLHGDNDCWRPCQSTC
jgi:hypothetical protein